VDAQQTRDGDTPLRTCWRLSLAFKQVVRGIVAIPACGVVEAWDIAGLIGLGLGGLALRWPRRIPSKPAGLFCHLADEPFQVGESVVVNNIADRRSDWLP
jgi:hypothetical protein